jgi:homoserine O-acetyltransferase/O-succinyltransferase
MLRVAVIFGLAMISLAANAADYPAAKEGDWVARDFRFHTEEGLP